MIVVRLVVYLIAVLTTTVAITDFVGSQCGGLIDGCCQVSEAVRRGLDEQNVAVGTDSAHHIQVERDFLGPPGIPSRIVVGTTGLINLPEAAVCSCAR